MCALRLISFKLCPFVQRSVITLELRDAEYDIEYIDLNNKPDWFLDISPLGKVPVLQVDDTVLFESAVINEYLDEITEGPKLTPSDPLHRAYARAWVEVVSTTLGPAYMLQIDKDKEDFKKHADEVKKHLSRFEKQVKLPFFLGDELSLVDSAAAPLLQRLQWTADLAPDFELFAETPKVAKWRDNLLELEAVKSSTVSNILELFHDYLRGRGSETRNVEPAWLASRL